MTMTPTSIPTTVALTGAELMAVAELATIRRDLAALEDRQKAIRAGLLAKMDSVGATAGTADGTIVVTVVESSRAVVSANLVRDTFPEFWDVHGKVTTFRSVRPAAPSVSPV